ncbi:MAG: DUF4919 domain-containing protein [Bacteroidota bacterium]
MKKVNLLIILLLSSCVIISQDNGIVTADFEKIDFKEIKTEVLAKNSNFNFEKLIKRYQANDTTLDIIDYKYLYYGYTFTDTYEPYARNSEQEKKVNKLLAKQNPTTTDYKNILKITSSVLKQNPFDLDMIWITHLSYSKLRKESEAKKWLYKFDKIIETIFKSGDGLSIETAMTVIDTRHEYIILEITGFVFGGQQSLVSGHYDYLKLKKNQYRIEGLYFNVERLLDVNMQKIKKK